MLFCGIVNDADLTAVVFVNVESGVARAFADCPSSLIELVGPVQYAISLSSDGFCFLKQSLPIRLGLFHGLVGDPMTVEHKFMTLFARTIQTFKSMPCLFTLMYNDRLSETRKRTTQVTHQVMLHYKGIPLRIRSKHARIIGYHAYVENGILFANVLRFVAPCYTCEEDSDSVMIHSGIKRSEISPGDILHLQPSELWAQLSAHLHLTTQ